MYKNYVAAEKLFIRVSGPERDKILYKSMLARCCGFNKNLIFTLNNISDVRNKKPQSAWDMMLKTNNPSDRMSLLKVIAQDCYIVSSQKTFTLKLK